LYVGFWTLLRATAAAARGIFAHVCVCHCSRGKSWYRVYDRAASNPKTASNMFQLWIW
jgi:hypothetical protein